MIRLAARLTERRDFTPNTVTLERLLIDGAAGLDVVRPLGGRERGAQRLGSSGGEGATGVAEVKLREQTLPGGQVVATGGTLNPRPEGLPVVGAHHCLTDPGLELVAFA